uniref:Uncharacterized protein n=1 Tax=Mycena chlorophos TaxID=658473 RepID=A0ABQ0LVW7_MYCCL|nr:predicted protein [Mycena chlorophos]
MALDRYPRVHGDRTRESTKDQYDNDSDEDQNPKRKGLSKVVVSGAKGRPPDLFDHVESHRTQTPTPPPLRHDLHHDLESLRLPLLGARLAHRPQDGAQPCRYSNKKCIRKLGFDRVGTSKSKKQKLLVPVSPSGTLAGTAALARLLAALSRLVEAQRQNPQGEMSRYPPATHIPFAKFRAAFEAAIKSGDWPTMAEDVRKHGTSLDAINSEAGAAELARAGVGCDGTEPEMTLNRKRARDSSDSGRSLASRKKFKASN